MRNIIFVVLMDKDSHLICFNKDKYNANKLEYKEKTKGKIWQEENIVIKIWSGFERKSYKR